MLHSATLPNLSDYKPRLADGRIRSGVLHIIFRTATMPTASSKTGSVLFFVLYKFNILSLGKFIPMKHNVKCLTVYIMLRSVES